jgi:hypothetical protein
LLASITEYPLPATGTVDLQAGKATLTTASLPTGRISIRVIYLGTTDFKQSHSSILIERVRARRPDAPPAHHSRNIPATNTHVRLLRRQAVELSTPAVGPK